jgi:hypothetical protein
MEAGMVVQLFSERRHGTKINEIAREPSGSKTFDFGLSPKTARQKDDQTDQQDKANPASAVHRAAPIKSATAQQKEKNDQNKY